MRVDLQQVATHRTELPDSLSLYHFVNSLPLEYYFHCQYNPKLQSDEPWERWSSWQNTRHQQPEATWVRPPPPPTAVPVGQHWLFLCDSIALSLKETWRQSQQPHSSRIWGFGFWKEICTCTGSIMWRMKDWIQTFPQTQDIWAAIAIRFLDTASATNCFSWLGCSTLKEAENAEHIYLDTVIDFWD